MSSAPRAAPLPDRAAAPAWAEWLVFGLVLGVVYGLVLWHFHGLAFPPELDEGRFWPTSLAFSHSFGWSQLRHYHELSTPLPFLIFAALQRLTGHGLVLGRAFNLALSAGVLGLIAAAGQPRRRGMLAALGLLVCPYYLGVATHLYTDTLALALVAAGLACQIHRHYAAAAFAWILAIATRQYMVAFPLAVAAAAFFAPGPGRRRAAWIWPLAASASLGAWIVFFGGLSPETPFGSAPLHLLPRNSLFLLTCLGLYYVLPEAILLAGQNGPVISALTRRWRWALVSALGLGVAFALFPPLRNTIGDPIIPSFGRFDLAARSLLPDVPRMILYCCLALVAWLRFTLFPHRVTLWLIAANLGLMAIEPVAWEKYALPLLAALWYLRARPAREVAVG